MKKHLIFPLFLCCFLPLTAFASDITNGFLLARTYKLGRENVRTPKLNQGIAPSIIVNCSDHCAQCDNGTCTKCKEGWKLQNNKCVKISCPTGQYLSGSTCQSCPAGCSACSGANNCAACKSGYHLLNGACIGNCANVTCVSGAQKIVKEKSCCCVISASTITNCETQNGNTCTKCKSGYYLLNNACLACPTNATCSGTSGFICKSGYYRSGDKCLSCSSAIPDCSSCSISGSAVICMDCYPSAIFSNGSCIHECDYWDISYSSCQKGYRKPKGIGSCTKCPANTMCGTCLSGCSGDTAGTCSPVNQPRKCDQCTTYTASECTCGMGYIATPDGKLCVSIDNTGVSYHCL